MYQLSNSGEILQAPLQTDLAVKMPLQRRLRHLFSLEIRNFSLINTNLSGHVLVHFTLQASSTSVPFYASERLPVSVDLTWGGFNIKAILSAKKQSIAFEQHVLASRQVCVKVWKYDQISQTTALLVEYNIDMVDLIPFNAAAYVTHGLKYAPNTLVVNLVHGSFAFVLPSKPAPTNSTISAKPFNFDERQVEKDSSSPRVAEVSVSFSNFLYTREPKKSYTLSSVVRMCTVAKALRQSAELALSRQAEIEQKLAERMRTVAAEQARERLRGEVEVMLRRLQKLEANCQLKRSRLEMLTSKSSMILEESDRVREEGDDLSSWRDNMLQNFGTLSDTLRSKRKMIHWRRGQMIADLYDIYCITRHDGLCFIANVPLPDAVLLPKSGASPSGAVSIPQANITSNVSNGLVSVPFSTMSVAIGYAAHYLLFIHWLFGIQPRYKIVFRGSHSAVFDHIHTQLASDADRTFPLYFPDRSNYQRFRYGIFLLARVASQLRYTLTQKKQASSGAQLLENISWTLHDLFVVTSRFARPMIAVPLQPSSLPDVTNEPRSNLVGDGNDQNSEKNGVQSSPSSIWINIANRSSPIPVSTLEISSTTTSEPLVVSQGRSIDVTNRNGDDTDEDYFQCSR